MSGGEKESRNEKAMGAGAISPRGRILFMDDKEFVRKAVSEVLVALGYEVECTEEGEKTLFIYRGARDAGNQFDIVVLDLTVSSGMGGRETIEKLLEIDPSVKIIVSSGYPHDPIVVDYRRFGVKGVIIKPYNSSELEEILEKVLHE